MNTHISSRPLSLPQNLPAALALADCSALSVPHAADWPYRFASWGVADPANMRSWWDASSNLLGWAVLQTPFWAIDCIAAPDAPSGLYREMIGWAQTRAAELVAAGQGRPMWFVSIDVTCDQTRDLLALGFEDCAGMGEDAWSKVLFELAPDAELPLPQLPTGFYIRNLDASTEIQAYVDMHREVFQSENMTFDWRQRATRMDGYVNALDLVVASDTNELCGFCVGWVRQRASGEIVGQIEPLGVREPFRGRKFSRQLMSESIRRLREFGATRIFVETDRQRESAMAAYESMGFAVAHEVRVYRHVVAK